MADQRPWVEWTDEELANEVERRQGLGAMAEAIRRLREAVRGEQHATTILTWVLVVFALLQTAALIIQLYPGLRQP